MFKKILGLSFLAVILLQIFNSATIQTGSKHTIYVQYNGKKAEFLRVWLDSTNIISDSIKTTGKMPPIIRAIGIGNLYQYKKITMLAGKRAYSAKIEKGLIDIVLNPGDSVRPIILYKESVKLK